MMLLTVIMAFAGAQTARAQNTCYFTFDISSGGTVEFDGETVTNGEPIFCTLPYFGDLTLTPETGYYVSRVTYDATEGLNIDLFQVDDFHWNLNFKSYEGSETPTVTVHIVFDKGLAGGADEASAVALTAVADLSRLTGGWYKVESDLTLGHTWNLHSDTRITIATGKTLTVSTSDGYGISGSALTVSGEGTLNVSANGAIYVDNYTQTGCAVTLSGNNFGLNAKNNVSISGGSLTTSGADWGIRADRGAITISGGTVSSSGELCGLFASQAMNITGGTVSASGDNNGIRGYSVSITGGQVTVSSGGIRSFGDITLGCTSATDYITASGFTVEEGFYVKIADGQKLYGGGFPSASYTGTIGDPSALNGLMLRPTAAVTESGTNEYTIRYADGWDAFCDRLEAGETFSGKTVKLGADITVSRMAGSGAAEDLTANDRPFCGTFDGGGNKLTFKYGSADSPADENNIAPFRYVNNATIQHLHVDGDIYTRHTHAGGIVGQAYGTTNITDCRSSVNIISSITGDGTHGGIMSCSWTGSTTSITGCLFDGSIQSASGYTTNQCGGFVGWRNATINVSNSLLTADLSTIDTPDGLTYPSATFVRNGHNNTITNCYYTQPFGTAQGKALHTVTAGDDVTVAHAGVATHYATSGITAYKATGASTDSDPFIAGLLYNNNVVDVLYAGSDDVVSLTLSNTGAPLGYQYGYTTNAGTLDDNNILTMPDQDVTISAALLSTRQPVTVAYINADGTTQTTQAVALDGHKAVGEDGYVRLAAGTYYVGTDITYAYQIYLNGNITLILANGKTMTLNGNTTGIYGVSSDLTIYGQSLDDDAGTLRYNGLSPGIIANKYVQHSGNVSITTAGSSVYGIQADVTLRGGTLTISANGNNARAISGTTHSILGGQLTATATGTNATGIYTYASSGTALTLGWTRPADRITASSISTNGSTVAVADGQALTDGSGNIYTGTLSASVLSGFAAETTLQPCLALADAAHNTAAITAHAGKTLAVALRGRTLYKDGSWNTLCLPFDISTASSTLSGDNVKAMTLNTETSNLTGSTLTLNFDDATGQTIPAGTPFIIKWDNTGVNIENPVFEGVTMSSTAPVADVISEDGRVQFLGTYGPTDIYSAAKDNLYLGAGNKLYYPWGEDMTEYYVNAFRAYFHVNGAASVRQFVLNFGEDGEAQGIKTTNYTNYTNGAGAWYSLDGQRLDAQPTRKGLYIHRGKKVVIP